MERDIVKRVMNYLIIFYKQIDLMACMQRLP